MPSLVLAEVGANTTSPPQSSATTFRSANSCLALLRSAPGASVLVTATRNGTPASLMWSIASIVCGLTPSSAATTKIATSVILVPWARMAVNAS